MGADFLLAIMREPPALDEDQRRRVVERHVGCLMTRESLINGLDPAGSWETGEFDDRTDDELREELTEKIIGALDHMSGRDVDTFNCLKCGEGHIVTGGMSWGDDPTEAYESISFLSDIDYASWAEKSDLEVLAESRKDKEVGAYFSFQELTVLRKIASGELNGPLLTEGGDYAENALNTCGLTTTEQQERFFKKLERGE